MIRTPRISARGGLESSVEGRYGRRTSLRGHLCFVCFVRLELRGSSPFRWPTASLLGLTARTGLEPFTSRPPQMRSPATNSQGFTALPLCSGLATLPWRMPAGYRLPSGAVDGFIDRSALHSRLHATTCLSCAPVPRLGMILGHRLSRVVAISVRLRCTRYTGAHNSETSVQQPDYRFSVRESRAESPKHF
jgi:hypothetical protein